MDDDISSSEHQCYEECPENSQLNEVVVASSVQQSRRPRLSSLQIPERSLETTAFTRVVDIPSAAIPSSNRARLPPRPNSARFTTASVWCDAGCPRLVQRPQEIALTGKMSKRCACFAEDQLNNPGLEVYEGCDYHATRCDM